MQKTDSGMAGTNADFLTAKARWVWLETLAIHRRAPETRIASSLSPIEIFVALYYGGVLRFDAKDPLAEHRDRLVISKGHGSICMYPILADLGFFDREELFRVCQSGGILGGIPDPIIPGYETINGSLGHGLGVASGLALALARKGGDQQVFVMTGDGELHEGACWEAIMFSGHHGLDRLNLIIDDNRTSMLAHTDDVISHGALDQRLAGFGWDVSVVDGHDVTGVVEKLQELKGRNEGRPKALIARTIKGRGVPGLENEALAHVLAPSKETLDDLLEGHE